MIRFRLINNKLTFQILLLIILIYVMIIKLIKINQETEQTPTYKNPNNQIKVKFNNNSTIYKIVRIGNDEETSTSYVTIVTIYFRLEKSKHKETKYIEWMENFFKSMNGPLVIYADKKSLNYLINNLNKYKLNAILILYDNIWSILSENELARNKSYLYNYLNKQRNLDPEKRIHVPELYAIWNLKSYLMNKTANLNPFKSKFFIYTDIGAWRVENEFKEWPNEKFVKNLSLKLNDKILFGQVNSNNMNVNFTPLRDCIEGGFFAGSKQAIKFFYENFYDLHDERMSKGLFIGKDQTMMNIMAFLKFNSSIHRLKTWNLKCSKTFDRWFFYQYFLANDQEYICENDRLSLVL